MTEFTILHMFCGLGVPQQFGFQGLAVEFRLYRCRGIYHIAVADIVSCKVGWS
jgi:hypothetical protein